MKIGERNLIQLLKAVFKKEHYIAFLNMMKIYPNFFNSFRRYFLGIGKYPYKIRIRTPLGIISPKIFSYYDILTVNEVFCRLDYRADRNIKVIVDLGSNIGISALYFLTRNRYSRCYLHEPVLENINKIHRNLNDFKDRYYLKEVAVSNEDGIKKFGTDKYGRCGGLKRKTGSNINVTCVHINKVLKKILEKEKIIDILKIDTEGNELDIMESIYKKYLTKIKNIFIEIDYTIILKSDYLLFPDYFYNKRCGNIIRLTSRYI